MTINVLRFTTYCFLLDRFKKHNFKEFSGILESFWRILDMSKRILELLVWEIPERILDDFSGIM